MNRKVDRVNEAMEQAKEAADIYKRLNKKMAQAQSWHILALLLYNDNQLGAAEETASRVISLLLDKGGQHTICQSHCLLGDIYSSKGKTKKALDHYKTALRIASSFDWPGEQFRIHHSLANLFLGQNRFDVAHAHAEHAKSHAINHPYKLGLAMELQARIWYNQCRLEEAKSEALRAINVYEKIGATKDVEDCRAILRDIERQ